MNSFTVKFVIVLCLLLFFQTVNGQQLNTAEELEKLLDKAEEQSQNYSKVFKNLSAEELKTKYYYKKNGELDEKRVIKSLFIVYELPDGKYTQEYRSVLEFNGKDVSRDEKEVEKFFSKLSKSESIFEKLFKEGTRYDGRSVSWGMTLSQERPFKKPLRRYFNFKVLEKVQIEGNDVWVIEYNQAIQISLIKANPTEFERRRTSGGIEYSTVLSNAFQPTNPLMTGKIWLDAKTAQIWRNEVKINLYPEKLSRSVVSVEIYDEYQPSEFGILLPKKFFVRSFRIAGKDDESLSITKDVESIYEYNNYIEFKTNVENYEIKK